MLPIRFELDRRAFGVLHFPKGDGGKTVELAQLQNALEQALDINIETRRERLFGPKVSYFVFQGEAVGLRIGDNGDVRLELGMLDDEVRETIIERLRQSMEFLNI